MQFVITSGLGAKDTGGHSQYAINLSREFIKKGHEVECYCYGNIEKRLPIGIRHLYFFFKILNKIYKSDGILTLDSFSVGFPSLLAAKLFRKRIIARIGGDFLWETYVNETGNKIIFREFYNFLPSLSFKQNIIFWTTKIFTKYIDYIVYNSEFQREIWQKAYLINSSKTSVIYNHIPTPTIAGIYNNNFIWAGRDIPLKNVSILIKAVEEIQKKYPDVKLETISNLPHEEVLTKIKNCRTAVLPSLSEMSPNFVIEAASYNKPFICTKESGLSELYPQGGIYIDPLNSEEIIEAMKKMLDNDEYTKHVADLKKIYKPHLWEQIAKEYLSLLCL